MCAVAAPDVDIIGVRRQGGGGGYSACAGGSQERHGVRRRRGHAAQGRTVLLCQTIQL